ncbi:hypothetical protein C8R43DRAFT_958950 [Mycena crocata]|nr:hypothetical protein C8R43DRAFT_958950 [Mycena crocata]
MSDPPKKLHSHRVQDVLDDVPEPEAFDDDNDLPDLVADDRRLYRLQRNRLFFFSARGWSANGLLTASSIPGYMPLPPQHETDPASLVAATADELIHSGLIIAYDINFRLRRSHLSGGGCARPCKLWVPKLHGSSHVVDSFPPACIYHGEYQDLGLQYYFVDAHYVGLTDGEAIERNWAAANPLGAMTKQMGAGERQSKL